MKKRIEIARKVSEIEDYLKEARAFADKGEFDSETLSYRWALESLGEVIALSAAISERSQVNGTTNKAFE